MTNNLGGTYKLGDFSLHRMGFGAMRLSGPMIYGPPQDPDEARRVLRAVVEAGINHIDTSDYYGPHITNQLIRDTLKPYPKDLVIVTKLGARRTPDAAWIPALTPDDLRQGIEDNLGNLGLDVIDVVNLRTMGADGGLSPAEGSIAKQFETLLELQRAGKIRHIGLSNVVPAQLEEALSMGQVVCVQNSYGVLNRRDEALLDACAARGIAFVPFFPLGGGFQPLAAAVLDQVAAQLGVTAHQVALGWLLHRSPNILLIPGTSKVAHLQDNIAAADITLSEHQLNLLNSASAAAAPTR